MRPLPALLLAALLGGCGSVSSVNPGGSGGLAGPTGGSEPPPPPPPKIVVEADPELLANPVLSGPSDRIFQVELKPGWNAVALQVAFVTEVNADASVVGFVSYENGHYSPPLPLTSSALNQGEGASLGLLIYANAASTLRYRGTPLQGVQFAGLEPGWNLIAPPADGTDRLMAESDQGPLGLTQGMAAQIYEVSSDLRYRAVDVRQPQPLDPGLPHWVFSDRDMLLMEKHLPGATTPILPQVAPVTVRPDVPESGFVCDPDLIDAQDPVTAPRQDEVRAAAYYTNQRWPSGSTLNVLFTDGDGVSDEVYDEVARLVQDSWGASSNLKFTFQKGEPDAADKVYHIRVAFLVDKGYNSYVGRSSLHYNPSMNLSRLHTRPLDSREFLRVVRHEFGHALGRCHEHQNPNVDVNWDQEAVYRDMARPPNNWTRERTAANYFRTIVSDLASPFDANSIMLYQIKASWTTDGFSTGYATDLSALDRDYSRRAYP